MAGTLNFPGSRGVSSNGRSPITPMGRVVYNMMIDKDEILVRESRLDGSRAAIQVAVCPAVWYEIEFSDAPHLRPGMSRRATLRCATGGSARAAWISSPPPISR